ncbi:MAG TPA: MBL fold metallo-hydrolase RNA specificity domain-containing protein, partial [Thermoproteota archaeon]|nr:MBL fold metallo-hydrolase RNA specificity domain-containing protein [Thermoproteota archaeon]
GRVLIPTLAVGRAQEVMLILDRAMANKSIEEAPVFVDGMITEVSKVHSAFPSYLSSELYSLITEEGVNPLESEYFVPIKSSSERPEALSAGKAVILSTSGMLEGGPVLEYFRHVAPEPKDSVLFVNYQIEGTLGQRVLSGAKQVQLYDEEGKPAVIDIKSQIHRLDGLSGHSDRSQLLTFARNVITGRGSLFLVHGERSKLRSLHRTVSHMFPHRATVPRLGERYRVL